MSEEALKYSHNILSQKLSFDLASERELKDKLKQYDTLGRELLEISKKSTHSVMVCDYC